jgi:hypothetical protein
MKKEYKAIMILRNGQRMLITGEKLNKRTFETKEEAEEAIRKNIRYNKQREKDDPTDIMEYKIYCREVTPWEEV